MALQEYKCDFKKDLVPNKEYGMYVPCEGQWLLWKSTGAYYILLHSGTTDWQWYNDTT